MDGIQVAGAAGMAGPMVGKAVAVAVEGMRIYDEGEDKDQEAKKESSCGDGW